MRPGGEEIILREIVLHTNTHNKKTQTDSKTTKTFNLRLLLLIQTRMNHIHCTVKQKQETRSQARELPMKDNPSKIKCLNLAKLMQVMAEPTFEVV